MVEQVNIASEPVGVESSPQPFKTLLEPLAHAYRDNRLSRNQGSCYPVLWPVRTAGCEARKYISDISAGLLNRESPNALDCSRLLEFAWGLSAP